MRREATCVVLPQILDNEKGEKQQYNSESKQKNKQQPRKVKSAAIHKESSIIVRVQWRPHVLNFA